MGDGKRGRFGLAGHAHERCSRVADRQSGRVRSSNAAAGDEQSHSWRWAVAYAVRPYLRTERRWIAFGHGLAARHLHVFAQRLHPAHHLQSSRALDVWKGCGGTDWDAKIPATLLWRWSCGRCVLARVQLAGLHAVDGRVGGGVCGLHRVRHAGAGADDHDAFVLRGASDDEGEVVGVDRGRGGGLRFGGEHEQ